MPGTNSIDGINSGLKTSDLVDSIINFERQNAVLLEYQQVEKKASITAYQALQAKFLGFSSTLSKLSRASTFEQSKVTVSDETKLTATATGRLGAGSYALQILEVARNHQLASQGFAESDSTIFGTGNITIQVGDSSEQVIEISEGENTLIGIKNAINNSDAGVTASIINDGTEQNGYRLILTSDKTGSKNAINITSELTGGLNLNYSSATFDSPETVSKDIASTSQISLGSTSAYAGSQNKNYTFTVKGTGTQTIGSDIIELEWSDGTNSGTEYVMMADAEFEVMGADGLTLNFSGGTLTAGDTFSVSTFAPTLQKATDAKIAIGSSEGGGSPITITSDSNKFDNVIENLNLDISATTEVGEVINVYTDVDMDTIHKSIDEFINAYNEVVSYIDTQNKYTKDSESAPPLFGDFTLWSVQSSLRSSLGSVVEGIDSKFNQLYSIGIRTKSDGKIGLVDSSRLEDALKNNLDDVIKLFANSGSSTNNSISFLSATGDTNVGEEFNVDITQVATHGSFSGNPMSKPSNTPITLDSTNNRFRLIFDGLQSNEIALTARTYNSVDELIDELQSKINNDAKIGDRGITVEWVEGEAGQGYLKFNSPSYGSTSRIEMDFTVENNLYDALALTGGTTQKGLNVEGTINGEPATGIGQLLTGDEDNKTTAGLKLKIDITEAQLGDGYESTVVVSKGVASRQADLVNRMTDDSAGLITNRISSLQKQLTSLEERVADIDELLALRRESLLKKFYDMETALGSLNATGDYLKSQADSLESNWKK